MKAVQEIKEKLAELCNVEVTSDYTNIHYKEKWGQLEFEEWLYNKLLSEKEWRKELMRFPNTNKKNLRKFASEFESWYGAKMYEEK